MNVNVDARKQNRAFNPNIYGGVHDVKCNEMPSKMHTSSPKQIKALGYGNTAQVSR